MNINIDNYLCLDLETYSKTDLVEYGLGRYLDDPTTVAYMWAYRLPGEHTKVHIGTKPPHELLNCIATGIDVMGHNIAFDQQIMHRCHGIYIEPRCCFDTALLARMHGLPGSLSGAGQALGIKQRKLDEGKDLIQQALAHSSVHAVMADRQLMQGMATYAARDVDAMIEIAETLGEIPARERDYWAMSHEINCRGFLVDVSATKRMLARANYLRDILDEQISHLTNGAVNATTETQKFANFMGLANADMNTLLACRGRHPAIDVMIEASRYPRKPEAILKGVSADGRLRHSLLHYGAAGSGRWSARGAAQAQMHNFVRPRNGRSNADVERALTDRHASLIDLAEAQRSLFMAGEGRMLVSYDLSGIEARILPWRAGDTATLDHIRAGRDLYKLQAVDMGWAETEEEVTKQDRQISKVASLALGFHGAEPALNNMAAAYHMPPFPTQEATKIVYAYRSSKPKYNAYWMLTKRDAMIAVGTGDASGCYRMERGTLYCKLSSGRDLAYHSARLDGNTIYYRDPEKGYDRPLPITKLINNQVQGDARDVFAAGMFEVSKRGLPVVHHVHDELVADVPTQAVAEAERVVRECLTMQHEGFAGLPVNCEGGHMLRWGK